MVVDGLEQEGHVPFMSGEFEAASLTVRLGAIAANYKIFRGMAAPAAVGGVVKADAYGLGMPMVARRLAEAGCDSFFVARLAEGIALRALLPKARIFVFDGAPSEAIPALIAHRLIPVLNSLAELSAWSGAAGKSGLDAALHVDTGMNRLGLPPYELSELAQSWRKRFKGVNLALVMSHLASADDPKSKQNSQQLARFRAALAVLPPAPASLAASAGILLGKAYHFDLMRPGVGLYGGHPRPGMGRNPMKTAAVLAARILQLRRIDKGEGVGYAASFRAKRSTMLATIALGYADGVPRALSNRGKAAIAGRKVSFAGRVSMDMVTLDVGAIPKAAIKVGGEVELIGDTMKLDDVAEAAGTNAYEILTRLAHRVPRHYQDAP